MGNEVSTDQGTGEIRRIKSSGSLLNSSESKKEKQRRITDEKLGNVSLENLPTEQEINDKFEQLVKELSLPEEKVATMRKLPMDKKWKLMKQHESSFSTLLKTSSTDVLPSVDTPNLKSQQKYIDTILQSQVDLVELTKNLVSLEVALRTLPLSWVEEFIDVGGLDAMLKTSKHFSIKPRPSLQERDVQRQFIRCFATIMNNSQGLRSMMRKPDAINTLLLGYDCDNIKMKAKLLDLMGGLSLVFPEGHRLVLDAFTNYQKVKLEQYRFQSVMTDFNLNDLDFQISGMAFLTAFVNAPEELDIRVSLRFEFMNLGVKDIITDLREIRGVPELETHLDTFEIEAESDFSELADNQVPLGECDINDPDEVFASIKQTIVDPDCYQWLLRLLQQTLIISNCDDRKRGKFFQLLWTLANEVTLQRNALRLRYHVLNFNIQKVIEGFASQDEFNQVRDECAELQKQVAAFGNDIQSVQELLLSREQQISLLNKELEDSKALSSKLESDMRAMRHKVEIQAKTIQELRGGKMPSSNSTDSLQADSERSTRTTLNAGGLKQTSLEIDASVSSPTTDTIDNIISATTESAISDANIPPPPPPMFSGPPPPPPPGLMGAKAQTEKPRLKIQPSIKMKQMNWSKINNSALSKTIWSKFSVDDEFVQNQLDYSELENLFGIVEKKKKEKSEVVDERKVINLLDSKKSYALSILLSRVKLSLIEIRQAILEVSEEKLSDSLLKQLQNYIPTPEEQVVLSENLENYDMLGKPEQFYIEILKISRYEQRLKSLNFKRRYQEKVGEILPNMENILKASTEVKNSKKLHQILEIVLTIGNFMNGKSFRGNAYGFQIDMLAKLADIRTNQKGNFMNYLCTVLDRRFPELYNVEKDLASVERASKISLQALIEEFNELKTCLTFLREELPRHENPDDPKDHFYRVMKAFLDISMPVFTTIDNLRFKMEQSYSDALIFYNEDARTTPDVFFSTFSIFLQNLDKARKENAREEEIARKAEQIKNAEIARLQNRQKKQQEILNQNDRGVMDELISSLKNGSFMAKTTSERRQNKRMSRMIEKPDSPEILDAEKLLNDLRSAYEQN